MATRGPKNDRWLPYIIVGGCALLALTIAAVGTLTLVGMGRDTPPDVAGKTTQQTTISTGPTARPAATPTTITISLAPPTSGPSPTASARGASQSSSNRAPTPSSRASESSSPSRSEPSSAEPEPSAPASRDGVTTYTVAAGDTLGRISARYGVSVQTIVAANGLANPESLRVGQELKIPAVDGLVYEVKAGDTVNKIAALYGVSAEDIGEHNKLGSSFTIQVGQKLVIPGATQPSSAATPQPTAAPTAQSTASGTGPTPTAAAQPKPSASSQPTAAPTAQPTAPPQPTQAPQATQAPQPTAAPAAAPSSFEWPAMGSVIRDYSASHPAIALSGSQGAPVLASAAGTVASVQQSDSGYGWHIVVDHGNGFTSLYANLSGINVKAGDNVGKLQVIGAVGSTGDAAQPQLHFEIRQNGQPLNPRTYLP